MRELNAQWAGLKERAEELINRDIPALNKKLFDVGLGAIWKDS